MWAKATEVIQHVEVIATSFFERIGENGQAVEGTLFVNASRERNGGFRPPRRSEGDWPEWVAEDAAEETQMSNLLCKEDLLLLAQ